MRKALVAEFIGTLGFAAVGHPAWRRVLGYLAAQVLGAATASGVLRAMFGGPISGASMNPVRSFGPALFAGTWAHHWIY